MTGGSEACEESKNPDVCGSFSSHCRDITLKSGYIIIVPWIHESMNHPKSVFFSAFETVTGHGHDGHDGHDLMRRWMSCPWSVQLAVLGTCRKPWSCSASWSSVRGAFGHRNTKWNSKWNSKWAHSESILSPFSSSIYSIYDFNSSLVLLFLNLMWRQIGKLLQLLPRQIDTTTYNCALEAPCFFFPKDWRVFGSSSNPWRFPARPVWPAATAAVQTRCCSKWSRWGMWMWSRTIRPMLRILRLVSKSRVNWELVNICRGT